MFILESGNNIKTHLKNFFIAPPGVHHLESFQLKLEPQLHKLGPINGFSPWWWRYACAGLKLELIPFHIFHIWVGLGLGGDYEISFVNHLYLLNGKLHNVPIYVPHSKSSTTQHPNLPSSFLPPAYETFASMHCMQWSNFVCWAKVNFRVAHLDDCESTRALWLRCPHLEFTAQSSPSRAFPGRSFLCPPILSDVANVDLVDDQPSNSFSSI